MKTYLAFQCVSSGDKGGLEGAVCSFLLATWLIGACFVALGSFTGGCQRSPSESCGVEYWSVGVLSSAMDRTFKALYEIHSTEMAFPSRSLQGDCSPCGNYIRALLRSFRNILYICIPRCSSKMIVVSRLCYRGAACGATPPTLLTCHSTGIPGEPCRPAPLPAAPSTRETGRPH